MISVARNTHMPRLEASRCCWGSAKWCKSSGGCSSSWCRPTTVLSGNGDLLAVRSVQLLVVVGLPGHDGFVFEVEGWRRRGGFPFESGGVPRTVRCRLAIAHGPKEINHGQQISDAENGCARSR